MSPCIPDPCNMYGATGEVCVDGACNCPDAPCAYDELCVEGVCEGMSYKHKISSRPIKTNIKKGVI